MMRKISKFALLAACVFPLTGCASLGLDSDKNACYIMYDAGSSGTRLYVYEQAGTQLIEHEGPKVAALADPVRGIRGQTPADIGTVTDDVVAALDSIKTDGPLDDGKPKWQGFDWSKACKVVSAKVYATAGMRIAEQENPTDSVTLWKTLTTKLAAKVGAGVSIETRTLTGYEEGLFAWLSVKGDSAATDFGIVEMGGASSQVTFPCADCDPANNAVNTIHLGGKPLQIYSYSYLGLGQDEAPNSLPMPFVDPVPADCAYGVGTTNANWKAADCADDIPITVVESGTNIRDPYNYMLGGEKGTSNTLPLAQKNVPQWTLTGAFNYAKDTDINECCVNKGQCFQEETACFRPIYLKKYLETLGVTADKSSPKRASWTQGAVICETEDCLAEKVIEPVCRWIPTGCLAL
jgi:hypothetical protein